MNSHGDCQILAAQELLAVMQGKRIPRCKYLDSCTGADACRRFRLKTLHTLPLVNRNEPPLWEPKSSNV
jgi:hypothetical protein